MRKRDRRKRLAALVLAAAMTLTLTPAALADGTSPRQGVAWEDMTYEHYDPEAFYEKVDQLKELAGGEDAGAITALYDELYDELVLAYTYDTIASLHTDMDITDEYWQGEMLYSDSLVNEMDDAFFTACGQVTAGPCAEAFEAYVGADAAEVFKEYIPATERELDLLDQESELINQYYEELNGSGELTYTYKGTEWTQEDLSGRKGDILYERDPDGYWEIYDGLDKALNDRVGPIFTELVQIRTELAGIWEYDDYASGMYADAFGRDFGPEDAQMLCDAVKAFSVDYMDGLYYSDLWSWSGDVTPVLTAEEQLAALGQYAGRIDPKLEEAWRFMTKYGLCYLTDDPDSTDTGYTVNLEEYDCPFIYNRMYNDCQDLDDLSHEFGHFTDDYFNKAPDPIASIGSYDLFEIHSTGLEALYTFFYDEIYDEGADIAKFLVLGNLVESIINGCIEDEFQRRVYAQPDMTLDEINRTYADVSREYGVSVGEEDYSWQYVPHNFESPLYYISYAVSALAALQIWDAAQADFDEGVAMYMDVLERGAYDDGYMTVLEACGMRLFTEPGAVEDICQPVIGEMEKLERAASRAAAA